MRPWLLVLAAAEVAALVAFVPTPPRPDYPGVFGGLRETAAELRVEGFRADVAADYVGARALLDDGNAYPHLTEAFRAVGIRWRAEGFSSHPPSALVVMLPIAKLRWKSAIAIWTAAMLALLAVGLWALGLRADVAAALTPVTLLWPPAGWSMLQVTPVWLAGLALAWRWRDEPGKCGAAIAVASLTKLAPAVALVPFLLQRRWRALWGFVAVWAGTTGVLLALHPAVISQYAHVARRVERGSSQRRDNASVFVVLHQRAGLAAAVAGALVVLALLAVAARELRRRGRLDYAQWNVWMWAGVALLPVAFVYSLLPLLPGLVDCVRRRPLVVRALAAAAFVAPFFIHPFAYGSGAKYALVTACAGVAVAAALLLSAGASRTR